MKQILLVAQREYLSQVKNKTFIIMTILSPLIIVLVGGAILFMNMANQSKKQIAVIDESSLFITTFASDNDISFRFYGSEDAQGIRDTLNDNEYTNALLIIPKTTGDFSEIEKNTQLITNGNLGVTTTQKLESLMRKRIEALKLEQQGISQEKLDQTKSNVAFKVYNVKQGKEESGVGVKLIFAGVLTYIIFMFIMIYGVKVMRSVVEEKNNRVVEIIISSVKPFQLMMGKILGTTFVAVTQFAIWTAMTLGLAFLFPAIMAARMPNIPNQEETMENLQQDPDLLEKISNIWETLLTMNYPLIIIVFFLFFTFGYLFYSAIFAAIGSAVDNDADTQQFTFYPIFPLIIAVYGSFSTLDNPDGPVSFWLSMIPLTSPISMITRIPFDVPIWQIALSLSILIGSTLGMVYLASRIYRVGILMYGKKPTFKEMWKWLRYSEN